MADFVKNTNSTATTPRSQRSDPSSDQFNNNVDYKEEALRYLSDLYDDVELMKQDQTELIKLGRFKSSATTTTASTFGSPKHELVSIKILNRKKLPFDTEMFLLQEISLLQYLIHPNIIQLINCVIYPISYSVVYEYFSGEDLQQKIANRKSYNELQARNWIQGIFDAVKYCHERNIVHR